VCQFWRASECSLRQKIAHRYGSCPRECAASASELQELSPSMRQAPSDPVLATEGARHLVLYVQDKLGA
jgi:hypothetical protein